MSPSSTFQPITLSRRGLIAAALLAWATGASAAPDGTELMKLNFLATKVSGFTGKVTMTLVNQRSEQRVRVMSVKSRLRNNGIDSAVLTGFLQPGDIKGTGFLQIENSAGNDDIWVYLPALSKTRRLAANNKRDSFFGTDFSYGDILLPSVSAYGHTWLRTDTIDGVAYHVVESKPLEAKTRDDMGYGRRITWLDPRNHVEHKVEYYDVSDKLLKTQLVSELKELDPQNRRWLAMRREMVNHQTGHKTLYVFDQVAFVANLNDTDFSVRKLEAQ
jgi:hypothetical protein